MQDAPDKHWTMNRTARPARARLTAFTVGALVLIAAGAQAAERTGAATTVPAQAESTVRLYARATISGNQVTLADVARLEGEALSLAADWPIAAAPRPGMSGTIDLDHVQSVLQRRGVNLSNWVFRGNSRCVLTRPAGDSSVPPASPDASLSNDRGAADPRGALTTRPADAYEAPEPDPNTLEGAIYAHIHQQLDTAGGKPVIHFSPAAGRLLSLSRPTYEFQITRRGERSLGLVPLDVSIQEKGRPAQSVQVLCEVSLRKSVVVAAGPINRGQIVQAGDLRLEVRTFDRLDGLALEDPAPLVGQRAKRLVRAGEQLGLRDIEPVPLVSRNDLVTVRVRRGRLVITGSAKAMGAGGYGDPVELRNELSRESFMGIVTGPKTVELSDRHVTSAALSLAGGTP